MARSVADMHSAGFVAAVFIESEGVGRSCANAGWQVEAAPTLWFDGD